MNWCGQAHSASVEVTGRPVADATSVRVRGDKTEVPPVCEM
jgi:hypothetical protein